MSEWRTEEQLAADENLHKAIVQALEAYDDNPADAAGFMLSEYIVITASVGISEDRAQHTSYDYLLANGSIPWHNMTGMMRWAKLRMDRKMAESDEDDE